MDKNALAHIENEVNGHRRAVNSLRARKMQAEKELERITNGIAKHEELVRVLETLLPDDYDLLPDEDDE